MARIKPTLAPSQGEVRSLPKPTHVDEEQTWTFTFRFFRQIENFGFDGANLNSAWFSSLFSRLCDLSQKKLSDFMQDKALQGKAGYRYHPINWMQKNIPIQRAELDWLPAVYKDNEAEYPIIQFQISRANGRVVGFFDERWNFNVLLLDPLHNIQPSRDYGYAVNHCTPLACEYTTLQSKMSKISKAHCQDPACGFRQSLEEVSAASFNLPPNAVIHFIDNDLAEAANRHISNGKVSCLTEILEYGIIYLEN